VGVFFVTQSPKDIPADVLGQLGNRVQHALRAFTADDATALKAAARTFPKTPFYDIEATLTSLGIGEALVTVLTPNGTPTPPSRPGWSHRPRAWARSPRPSSCSASARRCR